MRDLSPQDRIATLDAFREALTEVLAETRRSLRPFSVLLLDLEAANPHLADVMRREAVLARIGPRVVAAFRARQVGAYPARELDLLAWWDGAIVALVRDAGDAQVEVPAHRAVRLLERELLAQGQAGVGLSARAVCWSWSWRTCDQTAHAVLDGLREELSRRPRVGVAHVPAPQSPRVRRAVEALARLSGEGA